MNLNITNAENAVSVVKSGMTVFLHGSAATPFTLIKSLFARQNELEKVRLISISTLGDIGLDKLTNEDSFFINSLFVSENVRKVVNNHRGDYVPIFLSEISRLFELGIIDLDVAFINVSPPDKHGYCSLGVSVDVARSAVKHAKYVIAQINSNMPRTLGDSMVHISEINAAVLVDDPIFEANYSNRIGETEKIIGNYISDLVENGSTLQMGIGAIPDAVLLGLTGHKDLGIHTEMFSDGLLPLLESEVVTNKLKKKHRHKTVSSFAIGSKKLYDFIDDNPQVAFLEADYVNDSAIIRQNPNVVAINSALEIDITGQVCADSIGTYQYSGVGGQMDFIRGASLSKGGKPIIALNSTTKRGDSKIVPMLKPGSGVVSTRAHVHYIVTEYGVAYVYGQNFRKRAEMLRDIAHPNHREDLDKAIFERFGRKLI